MRSRQRVNGRRPVVMGVMWVMVIRAALLLVAGLLAPAARGQEPGPDRRVIRYAANDSDLYRLWSDGTVQALRFSKECESRGDWSTVLTADHAAAAEDLLVAGTGGSLCVYVVFEDGRVDRWLDDAHCGAIAATAEPRDAPNPPTPA